MLEYLTSHLYETQDYVLRFESTAITGKKMCSNSLFIKGPHNELAGLLCINFDSSRYQELSARVMDLCSNMLTPGVQSGTRLIVGGRHRPHRRAAGKDLSHLHRRGHRQHRVRGGVQLSRAGGASDPGREDGDHGGPEPQGRVPAEGLRQLCGQGAAQPEASIYRYLGKLNNRA